MPHSPAVLILAALVVICFQSGGWGNAASAAPSKYQRFCYLDTRAQLRPGAGRFTLSDLDDVTLCTHLVFVRALVDPVSLDLAQDVQGDFDYYKEVTGLKTSHPDLKVLLLAGGPDPPLQVGGVSEVSSAFSQVVNTTDHTDLFVDNVVSYLRYFGFDGLELDWRYPGYYGSAPEDVNGFSVLVRKLREKMNGAGGSNGDSKGGKLMLTVRVSGDRYILQDTVQLDNILGQVDYLVVTAYDFYLSAPAIGHNSGLYGRNGESSGHAILNTDYIIRYLTLYREVPGEKIILGMPSFGRSVVFINDSMQAFGAPHNGSAPPGPYTGQPGIMAFYEICSLINNGWTKVEDGEQLTPFAFSAQEIVTYDNPDSVSAKANYIKDNGLAGAALWDLSYDDFSGVFCDLGRFPLATALRSTLTSPRSRCPAGERGFLDVPGCEACPVGTYQPSENSLSCLPCPQGLSTLSPSSTHSYQCILPCVSGKEYNYVTSSCDPCPLGFYRQQGRDPACLKCPAGQTTVATASTDCVRRPEGVPEIMPRQIDVRATLTFSVTSCENQPVIIGAVRLLVADYFKRLAQLWTGLCHDTVCDNVRSDVIQGCGSDDVRRRKRSEGQLVASIILANVSEEVNNTETTRQTHRVIAAALSDRKEYEPLSIYGIRFTKLESLDTQIVCELGSAAIHGHCEQCQAGTYHNRSQGTCEECPLGRYQETGGQTHCRVCAGVMTTVTTGATAPDLCVSPCEARPNYCFNEGVCHWSEAERGAVFCQCQQNFEGSRCEISAESQSASTAGNVVGGVVGGVLAFLIIILIILACCICLRMRKTETLRPAACQQQLEEREAGSPNHYTNWGTFNKASVGHHRGVKFIDYIDYYMWLNNLSDHQQTGKTQPLHRSNPRSEPRLSPKSTVTTLTTPATAQPPSVSGGHTTTTTTTPNGNTYTTTNAETGRAPLNKE